jgi:hypothetical protein
MLLRLITMSVFGMALLYATDKPSPFPDKRVKETGTADRVVESATPQMAGTATFFRLKDDTPVADSLTAAHGSLPIGSRVRVVNEGNGKTVTVRITDRFSGGNGQVISVSRAAAEQLGFVRDGTARVKLELIPASTARY